MKHAITLLLSALSGACFAQNGVLTYDEMPPVGTTTTHRFIENSDVIDTTSGAGVIWDMSDIVPTSQGPLTTSYMTPASTPHPNAYPTSNYCIGSGGYFYYDLNAATMELVGWWLLDSVTYTNSRIKLTFPLQLGTTSDDTWQSYGMGFEGTYGFTCIGSGSLTLPVGTYDDVLLVRSTMYPSGSTANYEWIDASNGVTRLSYAINANVGDPNTASYVLDVSTGIDEAHAPIGLRVQGPVNDELYVTYASNEPVDAAIIGMNGAVLRHDRLPATAAPLTMPLDVAGIAPGIYCLELRGASGRRVATRFVRM